MKKNDNHIDIRTIEAYLKGQLPPTEMQRINALRSTDPFLDKALQGYEKNPESLEGYSGLQKRFNKSTGWWNSGKWFIGTGIVVLIVLLSIRFFNDSTTSTAVNINSTSDSTLYSNNELENTTLNSGSTIQRDSIVETNNIPQPSRQTKDRDIEVTSADIPSVIPDIDSIENAPSSTHATKKDTLINDPKPAYKYSGMEDILVLKYLNEFILKSYLASKADDPKSKNKKGKEELQELNNNIVKGDYKKAVEMIEVNEHFFAENKDALYQLISVHELVRKQQTQKAYSTLERIDSWHPNIVDGYRKLLQEFPK